jgi:hypothetical protein
MQEKIEPDAIIVREKWALYVRENEIERKMKEMINLPTQLQRNLFFNSENFPKRKIKYQIFLKSAFGGFQSPQIRKKN